MKSEQICLRVAPEEREELENAAVLDQRTLSDFIRLAALMVARTRNLERKRDRERVRPQPRRRAA